MKIELKKNGSVLIQQQEQLPERYGLGQKLRWLVLGVMVGIAASRAYYIGYLALR